MSPGATSVVCAGCGWVAPHHEPYPFRCPAASPGDGVDHVMARVLDRSAVRFPEDLEEPNPFVRYRELFHSYHLARSRGMSDEDYVDLVRALDKEVAGVDGRGFAATPLFRAGDLSDRLGFVSPGGVWVKDETGNVSGSHKARHLMGLLVHLEVVERVGLAPAGDRPPLAIASCGNAALAAAVVARAGGRALRVFVPTWADPGVVGRLRDLGAEVVACPREDGVPGDPAYHALQRALGAGALPFTCQGNENGLTIEGGETLGFELASDLRRQGLALDRLFVQVGGGALASACIQGLREAVSLGAVPRMPRIHAVQTEGGHPLKRAHDRVLQRVAARLGVEAGDGPAERDRMADRIAREGSGAVGAEMAYARHHRPEFMWPWEEEPRSVAHGILDDETYDWAAVVEGMLETGGYPVVVSEQTLEEANRVAREATGIDVDHTGSSGLAGLLDLRARGVVGDREAVGVLFTGARRPGPGGPAA